MKTIEMISYIIDVLIPSGMIDLTPGRHDINGESYYNVDVYTAKDPAVCRFEAHKEYIDIQYVVEGQELVYVTSINDLQVAEPYSEEKDVVFFSGGENVSPQILEKGEYLIFYPMDAHKPSVRVGEVGSKVKKVVFKVKINE